MKVPGASMVAALGAVIARVRAAAVRVCGSRPAGEHLLRAWQRFSDQGGGRAAAAVTYFGFLSFFPLIAVAFAVLGYVIDWYPQVYGDLTRDISQALPGLVGDRPGQVNVDQIAAARGGAGLVGVVGLGLAGTSWVAAQREALRSMWRNDAGDQGNFVVRKLRDVVLLAVLGIAMLVSVALSAVAALATGRVLDAIGHPDNVGLEWAVRVGALVFAIAGSTVLFAVMFVGLCGTHVPRGALVRGTLLAATGFEALKMFATVLLGHTMRNPVYATFSVAVGLLVWINFVSQVTLFAGAWTATAQHGPTPRRGGGLSALPHDVGSGAERAGAG